MKELDKLRVEINEVDEKLVELIERRLEISIEIGEYKRANCMEVYDPEREKIVVEKNKKLLKNSEYEDAIERVYELLMSLSKEVQNKL